MYRILLVWCIWMSATMVQANDFKSRQLQMVRVKEAYKLKKATLDQELKTRGYSTGDLNLLVRGHKLEKKLQVFVKKRSDAAYTFFREYDFCVLSGTLGPKRSEGDRQVPEGFYVINRFNPVSNFHLSLQINYPNASDKIRSDKQRPGSEIFIHGDCVSVGCIPITDDKIRELYILAVEATHNGQTQIPVYIFPCELSDTHLKMLEMLYGHLHLPFWKNLAEGYQRFEASRQPLVYTVDSQGNYRYQ